MLAGEGEGSFEGLEPLLSALRPQTWEAPCACGAVSIGWWALGTWVRPLLTSLSSVSPLQIPLRCFLRDDTLYEPEPQI